MKRKLDNYLNAVEKKLRDPITRRLLQFGSLASNAKQIRNEKGMVRAEELIRNSATNMFLATDGRDEFARDVHNFSATDAGYATVADTRTVGAIDVTILYLSNSLIPYVCMDRALDDPDSTVYYQNLIAMNAQGDIAEGETVMGNFEAPNMKVDLGSTRTITSTGMTEVQLAAKIIPGTVEIKVIDANGDVIASGKDYASDGKVYLADKSGNPISAYGIVAYNGTDAGKVTIQGAVSEGTKYTVSAERDVSADNDGRNVLRVTPDWVPVTLHTEPRTVIVENNIQNKMYMKKIATRAGSSRDMSDDTFTRAKNMVIEYQNKLVLEAITRECPTAAATLDFSNYDASKFADTKADMVQLFIGGLQARFLARTGINATTIITGSYGVTLLRSISGMWSDNPDAVEGPNGLAGYFASIPVFRHNYINNVQPQISDFYLVAKLPDNSSGTAIFGEYLPLTGTGTVSNFQMPLKISEGYFSMNGVKVVSDKLIIKGQVKLPVAMFSSSNW